MGFQCHSPKAIAQKGNGWFAEIKLRARQRIGQLTQELEKAQGARSTSARTKSKEAALKQAGLAKMTAHDYEQLAGPPKVQARASAHGG